MMCGGSSKSTYDDKCCLLTDDDDDDDNEGTHIDTDLIIWKQVQSEEVSDWPGVNSFKDPAPQSHLLRFSWCNDEQVELGENKRGGVICAGCCIQHLCIFFLFPPAKAV